MNHRKSWSWVVVPSIPPQTEKSTLCSLLTTVFAPFCCQQLEKELEDRQPQVSSLQEISSGLLVKGHGEDYIEAAEKVHVIEKKLKQLREQVAQDLKSLQERLVSPVVSCCFSMSRWRRKTGCSLTMVQGAGSQCSFSPFQTAQLYQISYISPVCVFCCWKKGKKRQIAIVPVDQVGLYARWVPPSSLPLCWKQAFTVSHDMISSPPHCPGLSFLVIL